MTPQMLMSTKRLGDSSPAAYCSPKKPTDEAMQTTIKEANVLSNKNSSFSSTSGTCSDFLRKQCPNTATGANINVYHSTHSARQLKAGVCMRLPATAIATTKRLQAAFNLAVTMGHWLGCMLSCNISMQSAPVGPAKKPAKKSKIPYCTHEVAKHDSNAAVHPSVEATSIGWRLPTSRGMTNKR